jgi:hypothetical protein
MRTVIRGVTVALLAAACVGGALPAGAAQAPRDEPRAEAAANCSLPRGARRLLRTRSVVVYRIEVRTSFGHGRTLVYGCHRRSNRRTRLADETLAEGFDETAQGFVSAGNAVAFALYEQSEEGAIARVFSFDLARRRRVHSVPAGDPARGRALEVGVDVVVKRNGSTAWIFERVDLANPDDDPVTGQRVTRRSVRKVDAGGQALLSFAGDIVARSLRLSGSTLTWREGAETRTAQLR